MPEPPITPAQREYLAAFDRWLRSPTERTVQERQRALDLVCAQAGVRARGRPEQHQDEVPTMTPATGAPRPTKVVLAEALAELQAREAKLKRLERELAENRAAIKVLRKLVGDTPIPQRAPVAQTTGIPTFTVATPSPPVASSPAREDRETLVLGIIEEAQPCARATLITRTGLTVGIVKATVDRLREAGKVQMVGQKSFARYWTTEGLAASRGEAA